jgi:hypothetical protein
MHELAKSLVSLPWAASVFGAQQMVNALSVRGVKKTKANLYRVTEVIEEQLAESPLAFALAQIGDYAQRNAQDLVADVVCLQALNPQWIRGIARTLVQQFTDAARALTPGPRLNTTWSALQNTFAVVNLVNQAAAMLQLPTGEIELTRAVERAYGFGAYRALWVVEGLGREYADRNWLESAVPRGLFTTGPGAEVPDKSLLMLHAGMGISFARRFMRLLTPYSSRLEIAEALRNFVSLVSSNARDGYEGAAFESLGLVNRTWYPQIVHLVDQNLWTTHPEILGYFWHGVGRAAYFSPLYVIPGNTPFHGIAKEVRHQLGVANATAGAAWAFTLVNINHPDVVVSLLQEYSQASAGEKFFSNGMISALMMATETVPGDPFAKALCQHTPRSTDARVIGLWNRVVGNPSQKAGELYLPILKRHNRLGEMFRYQDLSELARHFEEVRDGMPRLDE